MPAPITKAPSLRNAKKPSGRSPRGSKQASPRVARGQVGSPRSVDEEPLRPQSRWDFPTQQLNASRTLREMIARPKMSRHEWNMTDI